jgi:signal transduction histidine kinase
VDSNILIFIGGVLLGFVISCIYFKKDIKRRGESNLTIEAIIHELRTPLTGINWIFNSLSEVKLNDPLDEEAINFINEGRNKIGNAIGLANDALVALNTSVDYASYKLQKNNLSEVVTKVIEENSLGAKEKDIHIAFEPAKDVIPFSFDRIKITLAVRNLISNAIKYNNTGGRVNVELRRDRNQIILVVTDTGIGIPALNMGKIFSKFFRAKNVGETSGSGLGLFIVKNIVAGHGGRIDIQSEEGKGTKVTISLTIK